jgi:hypothetical protein
MHVMEAINVTYTNSMHDPTTQANKDYIKKMHQHIEE